MLYKWKLINNSFARAGDVRLRNASSSSSKSSPTRRIQWTFFFLLYRWIWKQIEIQNFIYACLFVELHRYEGNVTKPKPIQGRQQHINEQVKLMLLITMNFSLTHNLLKSVSVTYKERWKAMKRCYFEPSFSWLHRWMRKKEKAISWKFGRTFFQWEMN